MNLIGKKPTFRQQRFTTSPLRILILAILFLLSLFFLRAVQTEEIKSPFMPSPTPTRSVDSYSLEADTHFKAGNLTEAISTYQHALEIAPENARLWTELARMQAYSSTLLTTDEERKKRLEEALESAQKATGLATEDSSAHAVLAFVLDWNSSSALAGDQATSLLTQAEQEAVRAIQLDNQNTMALAFYAEILIDQQKWLQAEQYAEQAINRDPTLMDVHRVMAYVQESLGNYGEAIREYKKAVEITPNLTFLYIYIGGNYRILKQYQLALDFYDKAATIDQQLGVEDPIPYLAIGKTYSQMGEFFQASRNVRKALVYNPGSPDVYGQLGMVFFKARNYEDAIIALKCAVTGCSSEESCYLRRCDSTTDPAIVVEGMPLSANTVAYYFTYASALAGLHTPTGKENYCQQALQVCNTIRSGFSGDPTIMQIVTSNEEICASLGVTSP